MSSVVIAGDTSGSVTLQAPAVSGTTVLTLPSTSGTLSTSSGLSAATQAEMETATSNTVAVTPLSTNWHPGVAKAWLKCDAAGAIQVSHNITSITDDGTGQVTVTLNTDFSSANYVILLVAESSNGNPRILQSSSNTVPTAGAFLISSFNVAGTLADSTNYYAACFGDQT